VTAKPRFYLSLEAFWGRHAEECWRVVQSDARKAGNGYEHVTVRCFYGKFSEHLREEDPDPRISDYPPYVDVDAIVGITKLHLFTEQLEWAWALKHAHKHYLLPGEHDDDVVAGRRATVLDFRKVRHQGMTDAQYENQKLPRVLPADVEYVLEDPFNFTVRVLVQPDERAPIFSLGGLIQHVEDGRVRISFSRVFSRGLLSPPGGGSGALAPHALAHHATLDQGDFRLVVGNYPVPDVDDNTPDSRSLDRASGLDLDRIGRTLGLYRHTGLGDDVAFEYDDDFRERLKRALR
jgi:hypothetical protein